jgi:hypothetical protein
MNMSILAPATEPLVFDWSAPRRRNAAVAGFLAASLIVHAAGLYIFQIVYPPTIALLPPPARVNLITSNSEEGRTLLRWIEAEDPAIASTTRRPPDTKVYALPKLQHVPSYFATEPALKELPPLAVDLRVPSSQPPGPVTVIQRPANVPTRPAPTTVVFSKELESLGPPTFASPSFKASTSEPPQSVRFRIAVGGRGEILYSFPINSSGDPALDEQARNYLALGRFSARHILSPAEESTTNHQSLVWGIATVEWGNDIARLQPTSTATTP